MFDIAILGAGPGGYVAAIRAAQLGAKVVLIEKGPLGGTCLNRGCIPTKAMHSTVALYQKIQKASEFGIEVDSARVNYGKMMEETDRIVGRLRKGIEFLLKKNKIEIVQGTGELKAPDEIIVTHSGSATHQTIRAKKIILATGSEPKVFPQFNIDEMNVFTSTGMLQFREAPKSLLIIGGGVMGLEFAAVYAGLGIPVTIVEVLDRLLPGEDPEISKEITSIFEKQGVKIILQTQVAKVSINTSGTVRTELSNGQAVESDKVLVSIGRQMNTHGFSELGMGVKGQFVNVNEQMETSINNIYAIGDISGGPQLAHVASFQGMIAASAAMGENVNMDYSAVPIAIFTFPEIARVGLTEDEARKSGKKILVGKFPFQALGKSTSLRERRGFVKVIADEGTGRLLGIHMIGGHVSELLGEATIAIRHGLTANQLIETIHAHPTLPEAIQEAAESLYGRGIHS